MLNKDLFYFSETPTGDCRKALDADDVEAATRPASALLPNAQPLPAGTQEIFPEMKMSDKNRAFISGQGLFK